MSAIYTDWECQHCGYKIERYTSFGHPDEDFDYDWECEKCGHTNTLHVSAIFPKKAEKQKRKRGPLIQVLNMVREKRRKI